MKPLYYYRMRIREEPRHAFELCTAMPDNPTIVCYPEIPGWCSLPREMP